MSVRLARIDHNLAGDHFRSDIEAIGRIVGADAAYLTWLDDKQSSVSESSVWSSDDRLPFSAEAGMAIDDLPFSLTKFRWFDRQHEQEAIELMTSGMKDRERLFQQTAVNSLVNIPLVNIRGAVGAIGFVTWSPSEPWSESTVSLLRLAGQTLLVTREQILLHGNLTQTADNFRAMVDYAHDWEDWIGADGRPQYINPAVERVTGYTPDECMSMKGYPMPLIHEEDRGKVATEFSTAIDGSSGTDYRFRIRKKDGTEWWMTASWRQISDKNGTACGFRVSLRDASRQVEKERQLADSEKTLRTLIDSMVDSAVLFDTKGSIKAVNEVFSGHFDTTPADMIGKNLFSLLPAEIAEDRRRLADQVIRTGQRAHYESNVFGVCLMVTAVPILDVEGGVTGLVVFARDVTEFKAIEEELMRSQDRLERLVEERTSELAAAHEALCVERANLEQKNLALQELLSHIKNGRTEVVDQIRTNIDKIAVPILEAVEACSNPSTCHSISLLRNCLDNITSPFISEIEKSCSRLTPRELEVCNMVKNGFSSKQIASVLHISPQTVLRQRKLIRKKLSISGKKINLETFLRSQSPELPAVGDEELTSTA